MPHIRVIRNWNPNDENGRMGGIGFLASGPSLLAVLYTTGGNPAGIDSIEGYTDTGATYSTVDDAKCQYGYPDRGVHGFWPEQVAVRGCWNMSLAYTPFTDNEHTGTDLGANHFHIEKNPRAVFLWQGGSSWADVSAWTCWDGIPAAYQPYYAHQARGCMLIEGFDSGQPHRVYCWSGDSAVSIAELFGGGGALSYRLFTTGAGADDDAYLVGVKQANWGEVWKLDWTGASFNLIATDCSFHLGRNAWGPAAVHKRSSDLLALVYENDAGGSAGYGDYKLATVNPGSAQLFHVLDTISAVSGTYQGIAVDPATEDAYVLDYGIYDPSRISIYKYTAAGLSAVPAAYFKSLCDLLFARAS